MKTYWAMKNKWKITLDEKQKWEERITEKSKKQIFCKDKDKIDEDTI